LIIRYDAAFTSLRMLVGALSAVYLLNHGVSVVNIGLMKSMQAAIYFVFDIPSSYLADRYSRKAAVIISTILGRLWLLITGLANSVPLYFLAEALNALSLTIIGGVIQAYIIDNADDMENIHKIMGKVNRLSFFFMAVASLLGAWLAHIHDRLPWLVGGTGCLILAIFFGYFLPKPIINPNSGCPSIGRDTAVENMVRELEQVEKNNITRFFTTLIQLFSDKTVLLQAFSLISIALIFQFLLQYWQLLIVFSESTFYYGILFCFILLAQSLAGHITTKLENSPLIFYIILALAWICILGLATGVHINSNALKVAALVPLFGIIQILISFCGAKFHMMLKSEIRSTLESAVSTSAKFLAMLFMPIVAYAATNISWSVFVGFLAVFLGLATVLALYQTNSGWIQNIKPDALYTLRLSFGTSKRKVNLTKPFTETNEKNPPETTLTQHLPSSGNS